MRKFIFCILFGIVLIFSAAASTFAQRPEKKDFVFTSAPTRIIIPSLDISLPVYTAKVALNTWEVRDDGASFGELTALPGTRGNTVIFSHARAGLFGNLSNIKRGESIHIFTRHDWFTYQVRSIETVDPTDIDAILSKSNHELTLYTCTDADTKRLIVKAALTLDL